MLRGNRKKLGAKNYSPIVLVHSYGVVEHDYGHRATRRQPLAGLVDVGNPANDCEAGKEFKKLGAN